MAVNKINEATTELAQTLRETYQTVAQTAAATQERNAKFAQTLIEQGLAEMKGQAETTRVVFQKVAEQSEKQREALETLAHESVEAYIDLLFAPLAFYQKGIEAAQEAMR
jgi:acyl carrier protein phosphodiesterase